MVFKSFMSATAAIALMATPTFASAQATPVAPAAETVTADSSLGSRRCDRDRDGVLDDQACGGGFLIPLLALAAVILGILVLIDDDDEDRPISA